MNSGYSLSAVAGKLELWASLAESRVDSAPIADIVVAVSEARTFRRMAHAVRAAMATATVTLPVVKMTKRVAVKTTRGGGEQFVNDLGAAQRAIGAVYGLGWHCAAPMGETELAVIPAGLRSYKTERGTVIKISADQRIPAARYWPGGALPVGLAIVPDYPRQTPAWAGHSDAWHLAHGYVLVAGEWCFELGVRADACRTEAIEGMAPQAMPGRGSQ